MDKTLRRYFLFVVSLFINAFGVAFITKALLGTSPITSITYVLSLFTRLTMGEWTIVINVLFVVTEPLFMNRRWLRKEWRLYLLQLPVTVFFGLSIDCSMGILSGLNPEAYFSQIAALLAGCVILAAGIALEVKMDVAMTPGEYYVRVIAMRFKKDFGYVIAALIVGSIVHFISPRLSFLDRWVFSGRKAAAVQPAAALVKRIYQQRKAAAR